jgi:hypothetical protein
MRHQSISRAAALLATVLLAGCGHPEQNVVDKYFQAVNQKDNQTISSFALVPFDKKVDSWKITKTVSETKDPAPLSDLLKKQHDIEAEIAANKKLYNAYFLDHMKDVDEIKDLRKSGSKIPPKLEATAAEWEKFEQKAKELGEKGGGKLAPAKNAVAREKTVMMLSIGNVDDVEGLEGQVLNKTIELDLTIAGQVEKYTMNLRKYDVKPAGGKGAQVISRWVIAGLQKA